MLKAKVEKLLKKFSICVAMCLLNSHHSAVANTSDYDMPNDIEINDELEINDRFEKFNRKVFEFNKGVNKLLIPPATQAYEKITVTNWGRQRVRNILHNLYEPNRMINSMLYVNPAGFFKSGLRFVMNSTLGLGGLFDVATKLGVPRYDIDFSDVMAERMCIKNGPYIMLPILGPSTARNTAGLVINRVILDPFSYILPVYGSLMRLSIEIISVRHEKRAILNQISHDSVDEYAMLRGLYYQSTAVKEFKEYSQSKK